MNEVLTTAGHRDPPSDFVKRLKRFDPELRIVWGMGQGRPFAGWTIERRIPPQMKAVVYANTAAKPANRARFADQEIVDVQGNVVSRRSYDMMPDWHPVYRIVNEDGEPILELGEFILDYLRKNYERTLLGHPELGLKHLRQDAAEREAREAKAAAEENDRTARKIMENRFAIWHEDMGMVGQPSKILPGTEI